MSRTTEPTTVTQGEQIEWTRGFCDYPATEWTLEYRFRGPGTGFDIAATANGDDFDAVLTSIESAAATVGKWKWQAWATNIADPSSVLMIAAGDTDVLQGFPSSTAEIDLRTDAKKMLDALDAALLAAGTDDMISYEVTTPAGGRKVTRASRSEVISMRKYWAGVVARENAAERVRNGGKFGTAIKVRMTEQ